MTQPSTPARPAMAEAVAWVYCALGAAMVVALVALRDTGLAAAPVAVMGLGAAIAAAVGSVRNRPQIATPWRLFSLACLAFIVGAVLRQVLADTPISALADAATLSGYAATMAAFIRLLRCRQSSDRAVHELVDGAIVLVAVGAVALATLTEPTTEAVGMSWFAVVQGAYPVIDAVMIFVAILLSWTSASRVTSFWLLGLSVVFILIGDVGYAHIATQGQTVGSPLLDLPFVVAFTFFGAAALHPSMRALSAVQQRPVQAWSRGRVGLLVPMLIAPAVIAVGDDEMVSTWIGARGRLRRHGAAAGAGRDRRAGPRPGPGGPALPGHPRPADPTGQPARAWSSWSTSCWCARTEQGDRVDVLFLDLDSFKLVNDTWGHQIGDRVLRLAAQRLLSVTSPTDVVARIGGDEFAVARYVGKDGIGTGEELAADVVDAFRQPLPSEDALVTTVSIGLSGSGRHPEPAGRSSAESLLRDADTAMYRAKAAGRSRCMVVRPLDARLGAAPGGDRAGPALRAGARRAAAALPAHRLASRPARWWAPRRCCAGRTRASGWCHRSTSSRSPRRPGSSSRSASGSSPRRCGRPPGGATQRTAVGLPDLWVSVNVSARQLRDASLVDHVEAELARHGVPARDARPGDHRVGDDVRRGRRVLAAAPAARPRPDPRRRRLRHRLLVARATCAGSRCPR